MNTKTKIILGIALIVSIFSMRTQIVHADTLPLELGLTDAAFPEAVGYGQTDNHIMEFYLKAFGETQVLTSLDIGVTVDGSTQVYGFQMPLLKLVQGSSQVGSATLSSGKVTFTFSSPLTLTQGTLVPFKLLADVGTDKALYQFTSRVISVAAHGSVATTSTASLSGTAVSPLIAVIVPNLSLTSVVLTNPPYIIVGGPDHITFTSRIVNTGRVRVDLKNLTIGVYADSDRHLIWKPVITSSSVYVSPGGTYTIPSIKTGTTTLGTLAGDRTLFFVLNPDSLLEETSKTDNEYTVNINVYTEAPTPPPVISSIKVGTTTATTATLSWMTDILSKGEVHYEFSDKPLLASSPQLAETGMATTHVVMIPSLKSFSSYQFKIIAFDRKNQQSVSATSSFMTLAGPPIPTSTVATTSKPVIKAPIPPVVPRYKEGQYVRVGTKVYVYLKKMLSRVIDDRWLRTHCIFSYHIKNQTIDDIRGIVGGPVRTYAPTDKDKDGLDAVQEKKYGTNQYVADSDKDGYPDGEEVCHGYSPRGIGKVKK